MSSRFSAVLKEKLMLQNFRVKGLRFQVSEFKPALCFQGLGCGVETLGRWVFGGFGV